MKFFIDTSNLAETQEAADLGLLDGVTTNLSLLFREPGDPHEILRQITKIVEGPVSAEVTAVDHEGMVRAALAGADVVRMPAKVIGQLASRPLTDIGLERFLQDWEKVKNRS